MGVRARLVISLQDFYTTDEKSFNMYWVVMAMGHLLLRRNSGLYGEKLLGSYRQQGGQPHSCQWIGHVVLNMAPPSVLFRKGRRLGLKR